MRRKRTFARYPPGLPPTQRQKAASDQVRGIPGATDVGESAGESTRTRSSGAQLEGGPVGMSLNGTPLSARVSGGRRSTRSAMMLRSTSSVPPAIRRPGIAR